MSSAVAKHWSDEAHERQPESAICMRAHLAYLAGAKEFVVGGAVFPSAPQPVGNEPWGRSYAAGAINEVGRGSNKARTDAINAWLEMPTDFRVEVKPEP